MERVSGNCWLSPKRAREQYSLSEKELRRLRMERIVTYRPYGNKFIYSENSLDAYFKEGIIPAEPQIKIVEKAVPIYPKGGDSTQKNSNARKMNEKLQGGNKMRWVKELDKNGKPNGCVRLNCGDFSLRECKRKSKIFYDMDYRDEKCRHTKSLRKLAGRPIKNRLDAYETARRIRNEMYEYQAARENPDITYSEYLPQFLKKIKANKTIRYPEVVVGAVKKLGNYFGDLSLREISQKSAEKYRDHRRKLVSDPTIDAEIGRLNQILIQAEKDGYKVKLITRSDLGLESAKERKEFMTPEMEEVIWPLLRKYQPMPDLADFILNTSMREINIIQLEKDNIRWDEKPVPIAFVSKEIHKNKTEDGEYLLNPEVLKMLKRRQNENGSSRLVFVRYEGQNPKPITESWIQRKWRAVKEEANQILKEQGNDLRIPNDLRFYDLRATCLSRAGANGATEYQLMAISNHKNPHSLKKYVRKKPLQESAIEFTRNGVKTGVKK